MGKKTISLTVGELASRVLSTIKSCIRNASYSKIYKIPKTLHSYGMKYSDIFKIIASTAPRMESFIRGIKDKKQQHKAKKVVEILYKGSSKLANDEAAQYLSSLAAQIKDKNKAATMLEYAKAHKVKSNHTLQSLVQANRINTSTI